MHLDAILRAAELADIGQESLFKLGARSPGAWGRVVQGYICVPLERNATPPGYQGPLSLSLDDHLQALVWAVWCLDDGAVTLEHLRDTDPQLRSQRLGERLLHDPLQSVEAMEIVSHPVVLHDTPIFLLVSHHRVERGVFQTFRAVDRFTVREVGCAFAPKYVRGHPQTNHAVNGASSTGVLGVVLHDVHLVAKEARGLSSRVGDQRLGLGEFQFELLTQELTDLSLDLLGFCPWPEESKQEIVGIPDIPQAAVRGVFRKLGRKPLHLFAAMKNTIFSHRGKDELSSFLQRRHSVPCA